MVNTFARRTPDPSLNRALPPPPPPPPPLPLAAAAGAGAGEADEEAEAEAEAEADAEAEAEAEAAAEAEAEAAETEGAEVGGAAAAATKGTDSTRALAPVAIRIWSYLSSEVAAAVERTVSTRCLLSSLTALVCSITCT